MSILGNIFNKIFHRGDSSPAVGLGRGCGRGGSAGHCGSSHPG